MVRVLCAKAEAAKTRATTGARDNMVKEDKIQQ